jgi:hypothetical protein
MRDRPGVLVSVGLVSAVFTAGVVPVQGQMKKAAPPADRAMELVRREARAKAREREETFARIKRPDPAAPMDTNIQLPIQIEQQNAELRALAVARARVAAPQAAGRQIVVQRRNLVLAPAPRIKEGDDEPEDEVQPPARVLFTEDAFERQIFMNTNADGARERLNAQLKTRIAQAERTLRLSPAQKERLRLAGQGDIKRFFDQVDEHRRVFDRDELDMQEYQVFVRGLSVLRLMFQQGMLVPGSLFDKTLRRVQNEVRAARNQGGVT